MASDPAPKIILNKYSTQTEKALAIVSISVKFMGNHYIVTRLILPSSVSAESIELDIHPSKRTVALTLTRSKVSCSPQVALGISRSVSQSQFQSFAQGYRESLKALRKHQDDEIKNVLTFDIPFEPEPRTSKDLPNLREGQGLKPLTIKVAGEAVVMSAFFFVLKRVDSSYAAVKKVKGTVVVSDTTPNSEGPQGPPTHPQHAFPISPVMGTATSIATGPLVELESISPGGKRFRTGEKIQVQDVTMSES